jgi:uncharacterized membrane protein (UPF0127 family)
VRRIAVRLADGAPVAPRALLAERWNDRLRGLLGRRALDADEGLLLVPCRSIHMIGMRFPIDAALLDREGRVLSVVEHLRPGFRMASHRKAYAVLEVGAGTLRRAGVHPGSTLSWEGTA